MNRAQREKQQKRTIEMSYTLEENVLILFDSGGLKDRIAEMMDITKDEVDRIIDERSD